MDVGERISLWRKAKKMTPKKLAAKVGVSVAAVYQWEGTGSSKTQPALAHLEKVVKAFGISMERFYGRAPEDDAA